MDRLSHLRLLALASTALALSACAQLQTMLRAPIAAAPAPAAPVPPRQEALPEAFESEDFVVTFTKRGDTPERLAARFLGDPGKAWMIEDYNERVAPGQEVVIPKRPWNLSGVDPSGYQLVPVLVYHNIAPQARGRLTIAANTFEEQMRYLKTRGYRVVSLTELYEFIAFRRQLPRRAVVINFDDGYKSFLEYAHPILKKLGFTATLFIYTDYVGAGRNALTWDDLRRLVREGFDIQPHSKTHSELRRKPGESGADYARRMQAELGVPQTLFRRHLGRPAQILAYPYGHHDEEVIQKVKEFGYVAAFSVHREGNPSFVYPLRAYRSQIYSETTLGEFARNLTVFSEEPIK